MSDLLQKLRARRPFLAETGRKAEEFSLSTGRDGHSAQTDCRAPGFMKENRRPREAFPPVPINYYPKEPVVGEIKKRGARAADKKRQNAPHGPKREAPPCRDSRLQTEKIIGFSI